MPVTKKKKLIRKVCETMTDPQLIELTLAGQPVAYDVLVKRYTSRVEAVVAQFLRGADKEDCVQETFLKALIHLPDLRDYNKFGSWLRVIARNICLDTIRKTAMVTSIDDNGPWESIHGMQIASTRSCPLTRIIRFEDQARLRESMSSLGEKYRTVLDMRYFNDCDYAAIADTMQKPLGTIKSLIHRGHEKLRDLLTDRAIQGESTMVN